MIYSLRGKIKAKEENFVVMEVSGIGYKVLMTPQSISSLPEEKEISLFCHLLPGEKELKLFGFPTKGNLDFFQKLLKISGIGPQTALKVASIASMEELKRGVEQEDKEIIREILKIGKKKGERVIFEISGERVKEPQEDEVFQALKELGFSKKEIESALKGVSKEKDTKKRIEEALKNMSHGKKN